MTGSSDNPGRARRQLTITAAALAVVVLTTLAYIPAMQGGYIWDDDMWVTENPLLAAPDGLSRIWFSHDQPSQYFPMVYTTFLIEYSLWELEPAGYHITNVVLHILNALLLWGLLARLKIPGAWLAAILFALHPVHVESVAWVTERKNVLTLFFAMLSLHAWWSFRLKAEKAIRAYPLFLLSLLLYCLALLSKTTACTLPAALVLILWYKRIRLDRNTWLQVTPYVGLGVIMGLVTMWWERYQQGMQPELLPIGIVERGLIAGRAVWFYLGKLAWPFGLTFSYPRWNIDPFNPVQYLWPLAALCLVYGLWHWRARLGRAPLAAYVFFVATLSPMLGFILLSTFAYSFVADHYQYVASIGPLTLVAAAGTTLAGRYGLAGKRVLILLGIVVLGGCAWQTRQQSKIYHNNESLWRDTLTKNPESWMAHNNLGTLLRARGESAEAIQHYQSALEIRRAFPGSTARIRYNLANALRADGQLDEAAVQYMNVIEISPTHARAINNLGNVLLLQGKLDEAIARFTTLLAQDPGYADGHFNLANALRLQGDTQKATEHYRQAIQHDPQIADAHYFLGRLLRATNPEEAVGHFSNSLKLNPRQAPVHVDLAQTFIRLNRVVDAVTHYREAVRLEPESHDTLIGLAWLLATSQDPAVHDAAEAVELASRARILTDGNNPTVLYTLAAAYAADNRLEDALETAERALTLAEAVGAVALAGSIRTQIERYRQQLN